MSYVVLSILVVLLSGIYEKIKNLNEKSKGLQYILLATICLCLCVFAGLRTEYNDTSIYIRNFKRTPTNFSLLFETDFAISNVYGFHIFQYFIYNYVSTNPHVFLFLCAVIFVVPCVLMINKYSKAFTFSMFLFMTAGAYLFSLAGIKQALATGVMVLGFNSLINKKTISYYLYCLLAISFHTYAIFFLIIPIFGSNLWDKKLIVFGCLILIVGIGLSQFSKIMASVIEFLGKDVEEEIIEKGSVNAFRALVYLVPFVLSIIASQSVDQDGDRAQTIWAKVGIVSTWFMVLALFGNPVLFGRIPQYFLMGIVISLPNLIEKAFKGDVRLLIVMLAVVGYTAFAIYGLYVDKAFSEDIFKLAIGG